MHQRTVATLNMLVDETQKLVKAGKPLLEEADAMRLLADVQHLRRLPDEGERYIDDMAVMLAQSILYASQEGYFGEAMKYIVLAQTMLKFIQPKLYSALCAAHHIPTSDHSYAEGRK